MMSGNRIHLDIVETTYSRFDEMIEWLLVALLSFAPLAFGAVEAWSEQIVLILAAAISTLFLLKCLFEKNTRLIWSWSYVPAAMFILIVVLQLMPLPSNILGTISPDTVATKNELLGDLPNPSTLPVYMTMSFYPNATKHDIRLVLAVVAVFFVVLNVHRRPDQIKRLLGGIAITGGSIALLALLQDLFGNGRLYWTVAVGQEQGPYSGPFVNHSHYGQFMNLSIGAAFALLMVKINEAMVRKRVAPLPMSEHINSAAARPMRFLLLVIVVGSATVFVSLTRGGMLSMLIATGITALVLALRKSTRASGWLMLMAAFAAFMCLLNVGFDPVYDRLASLRQFHQVQGGRWQILKDIAVVCSKFPAVGTGLGTHEVVFPMFDRSAIPKLAVHAENEYAQLTEETGFAGLATMVLFGIIIWAGYVRSVSRARTPICSAAYGLGFGLLAIMIHSLSDFGQHLPANALLSATFCALLLSLARMGQKRTRVRKIAETHQVSTPLRLAALACISGVWAWALLGANSARLAEAHWRKAHAIEETLIEEDRRGTDEEYVDMIANAAVAADYQPDNVRYRHWLNVYRWQSVSGLSDPNTGEVILSEEAVETVHMIVNELHDSRLLCPTYGPIYCVLGQLERSVLEDPVGADRIRKGFRLTPNEATVCFVAGLLEVEEGRIEAASAKLDRAVQLDGRFFTGVADMYVNLLNRPDLAVRLVGKNANRMIHVVNLLAETDEHQDLAVQARRQARELLASRCKEPDAPAVAFASLAKIYRIEKNKEAAIEHYRRALVLDYGQIAWRLALTKLLAETNKIPEAIREARTCVRLGPQVKAAERLLADLSVLPGAVIDEDLPP